MYPELSKITTGPTRKDAILDYVFTNFPNEVLNSEVCYPLESSNKKSDHKIITYDCLLYRPATFAWETHEFLKVTEEGSEEFSRRIKNQDWSLVSSLAPNMDKMAEKFNLILDKHLSACFSWKRLRKKSTESPWLSEGLRRQMRVRKAVFRQEGRSHKWIKLDKAIKKTFELRKGNYFNKESDV